MLKLPKLIIDYLIDKKIWDHITHFIYHDYNVVKMCNEEWSIIQNKQKHFFFFKGHFSILTCILTPNIPLCFLSLDTNNEWNMRWPLHKKLYHMPYWLYNSLKTQKVLSSYALPIIQLIKNTKSFIIICLTDYTTLLNQLHVLNHFELAVSSYWCVSNEILNL